MKRGVDKTRSITVQFDTNVNPVLPWRFKSEQRQIKVHPGELREALFTVENLTGEAIVGQAVPSVAPGKASIYFKKTECFCFTQQVLQANESREMPVRFIIDPDVPKEVEIVTLSYTFFMAPDQTAVTESNINKQENNS